MSEPAIPAALERVIESLAAAVVADYLRAQAAAGNDGDAPRTNPVALPPGRQAA